VWVYDGVFLSDNDANNAKGLRFLCRHLVGLCVTYRHTNKEEAELPSRFATCSGTLLFVEGALYFLTAGHVLKELKELRDNKAVVIEHASLADVFGYKCISDTPIPFDIQNSLLCFIDDDELGLDFGIIPIGPHHARLLAKNGIIALSEQNWIRQRDVVLDGYLMLGFPAEKVSERVSDTSRVTIEPTAFSVKRLEVDPEQRSTTYPQFLGQVSDGLPFKSLKGMSGGLIFGFRSQPQPSYWVVAIQSSWHPGNNTVRACSLPVLASLMTHWARENIAVLQEIDSNTAVISPTVASAALARENFLE
jgi:hypothetical protein